MSFFRIFATKDTSIANYDPGYGTPSISSSNVGASEILNLYKTVELAATASVLIAFSGVIPASGSQVVLKLFDAQHANTLPSSYTVTVRPLEQDWAEGTGLDQDFYTDVGVANWLSATVSTTWSQMTGSTSATFFFTAGHEDVEVDVTALVPSLYGFRIDIIETGTDFYIKEFHARNTHFPTKRPYLEYRTADATGSLSSTVQYVVLSGFYSGTVWPSSSIWAPYVSSGTMSSQSFFASDVDPTGALVASFPSLKSVYDVVEAPLLRLQCQRKDWNPATVTSGSSVTTNVVLTKAYLRITDVLTEEVLVPFSTGAVQYARMSYDDSGSFFRLPVSSLPTGSLLQLDVLYEAPTGSGNWTLVPGIANRFRVISHA